METEMHEMVERLRHYRAAILSGNDKLEKFRQVQQWNEVTHQSISNLGFIFTNLFMIQ